MKKENGSDYRRVCMKCLLCKKSVKVKIRKCMPIESNLLCNKDFKKWFNQLPKEVKC